MYKQQGIRHAEILRWERTCVSGKERRGGRSTEGEKVAGNETREVGRRHSGTDLGRGVDVEKG